MVRTQIQLPDPLYQEVRRVAEAQDWSVAEVIRRGAEAVVRAYPGIKDGRRGAWKLPPPIKSKMLIQDAGALRDRVHADIERPSL